MPDDVQAWDYDEVRRCQFWNQQGEKHGELMAMKDSLMCDVGLDELGADKVPGDEPEQFQEELLGGLFAEVKEPSFAETAHGAMTFEVKTRITDQSSPISMGDDVSWFSSFVLFYLVSSPVVDDRWLAQSSCRLDTRAIAAAGTESKSGGGLAAIESSG